MTSYSSLLSDLQVLDNMRRVSDLNKLKCEVKTFILIIIISTRPACSHGAFNLEGPSDLSFYGCQKKTVNHNCPFGTDPLLGPICSQ